MPDENVSFLVLLEKCTMPCNSSHRYIHHQRVLLAQSVYFEGSGNIVFSCRKHYPLFSDPYDFIPVTITDRSLFASIVVVLGAETGSSAWPGSPKAQG